MRSLWNKISLGGLLCLVIGAALFSISFRDTLISFQEPKSFEDVLVGDVAVGDHVQGRVPYLLDSFAVEQTWTQNRSNGSVTPKKNSRYYFILPVQNGYLGLTVNSSSASEARSLADQTYGYLAGGAKPTAELTTDARAVRMDEELAEMFIRELKNTYGLSDRDIDSMGTLIMIEPRGFSAIRVFCAVGCILTVVGFILFCRKWRRFGGAF